MNMVKRNVISVLINILFLSVCAAQVFVDPLRLNCELKLKDFPDNEPVLAWNISGAYKLIEPKGDAVQIVKGQDILISCPGVNNNITKLNATTVTAKCHSGEILSVKGVNYNLSDFGCKKSVTGEVEVSTDSCGQDKGIIKHIGHKINNEFLTLIDVCYDDRNGTALYANHVLYGSSIDYAKSPDSRPGFKVGGLGPNVDASNAYKQSTQIQTFAKLLGSTEYASKYINSKSYNARGHLAPDGDFIFVTSQFSTYFYINTVPQWQQINNGNWKSVETEVRSIGNITRENFQIYTGIHETLVLPNKTDHNVDIYLIPDGNKLLVPNYIWKVIKSLDTGDMMAFVNVNNPFLEKVEHYLCKDICDETYWGTSNWKNVSKGLTYCCDVEELKQVVKIIPDLGTGRRQEGPASPKYSNLLF